MGWKRSVAACVVRLVLVDPACDHHLQLGQPQAACGSAVPWFPPRLGAVLVPVRRTSPKRCPSLASRFHNPGSGVDARTLAREVKHAVISEVRLDGNTVSAWR